VPARLRPTTPLASDAILVGDPGRALLLAQELLVEPKMSNHARGLWGYSGKSEEGRPLTIQSTGMGGPSAALVLADLAELGVQRAVRVGTCVALDDSVELGDLLLVTSALAIGGSAAAHGTRVEETVYPHPGLSARLREALGEGGDPAAIASFDAYPPELPPDRGIVAADMQTATLSARAEALGVELAVLLIATETAAGERLDKGLLETVERGAGHVAAATLSP
jgi:uridine phosphorylase